MTLEQLNRTLDELGIKYLRYTHPPLHTSDEADRLGLQRKGQRLKNLFLKDNYGRRHFLLLVAPEKQVDLKTLSRQMQVARLGFASQRRLEKYLKVKPGCVSLLALLNDSECQVELWVDESVAASESFQCHPMVNTETYVLNKNDVDQFLQYTGHQWQTITVPSVPSEVTS